MAVIGSKQVLV